MGNCARPDAGILQPQFSAVVADGPLIAPEGRSGLLALDTNLYFEACPSGGSCRLTSFTSNGFLRYSRVHADRRLRQLALVDSAALIVTAEDALEAYDPATGNLLWSEGGTALTESQPSQGAPEIAASQVGQTANGDVIAAIRWGPGDGGNSPPSDAGILVRIAFDSGVVLERDPAPLASRLALNEGEELYLYDTSGSVAHARLSDGGLIFDTLASAPGSNSLVAIGSRLVAGGAFLLDALDGGQIGSLLPVDVASNMGPVLASRGQAYVFYRACLPDRSCAEENKATIMRSVDLSFGSLRWEVPVLPPGEGSIVDATLVTDGGILIFSEIQFPDAPRDSQIHLFKDDQELFTCRIPSNDLLGPSILTRGSVYVLVERAGRWFLEAYDLSMAAEPSGWGTRDAVRGTKHARP
jgi:hypothetical protein